MSASGRLQPSDQALTCEKSLIRENSAAALPQGGCEPALSNAARCLEGRWFIYLFAVLVEVSGRPLGRPVSVIRLAQRPRRQL